ncbi:hypothetical protein [Plantibacter sp. YIM 135347]|uniref:hypothetical protein n=1 Tax=Plantibacter sp. YIM 135347 TaxID=3423919 RepID=UPI003D356622
MGESAEDQAAALPNVQPSARPNAEPSALPGSQPTLAPSTRVLLSLAGAVILLVGMSLARDVLTPLFVAAVLVIIVHPVRTPLERHGSPRWLATTAVIAVAYLVLVVLGAIVHTVTGLATSFFFVLAYFLFMAADAARFEDTARRFAPTKARAIVGRHE